MNRHFTLFFYFFILSFILPLIFSCGPADTIDEGSNVVKDEPIAERGMVQAQSQDFTTSLETIDQDDNVRSEFGQEAVGIRVRILNKSAEMKTLMFNEGKKAKIEISRDHSLIWSNDRMASIQVISEENLAPNEEMSVVIPWNQLTDEGRVAGRGIYQVRISEVKAQPVIPVPPVLEFEVR